MSGLRPAWSWITILIVDFLGIFPAAYLLNQEASIRAMKPESRTLIDMPLPLAQGEKIITPSGIVSGLLAASIYFLFIFMVRCIYHSFRLTPLRACQHGGESPLLVQVVTTHVTLIILPSNFSYPSCR